MALPPCRPGAVPGRPAIIPYAQTLPPGWSALHVQRRSEHTGGRLDPERQHYLCSACSARKWSNALVACTVYASEKQRRHLERK